MVNTNKKKNQPLPTGQNVLESIKDLGLGASDQVKNLVKDTSEDFFRELLGLQSQKIKRSGELLPGKSVNMGDILNGKEDKDQKTRKQFSFENTVLKEESRISREKTSELKMQLQSIMEEVKEVAESTQGLAEATKAAALSAPIEPGIYHIRFFQNLLEFLKSFRKRIDLAATWLNSSNKRAEKKNYWNMYKKKGSSFLLSPEHYSQRSAG